MTGTASASNDATRPSYQQSEHAQAMALWTYVHLNRPRFSSDAALTVVRRLAPSPSEDVKSLAKRLRKELAEQGIALKHNAALQAASRLLGYDSWYAANRDHSPALPLRLSTLRDSNPDRPGDWRSLLSVLRTECDEACKQGARVFELRVGARFVMVSVQGARTAGSTEPPLSTPLLTVTPVGDDQEWLSGAPRVFETLRRHLEESGNAVLDGVAVLQLCDKHHMYPSAFGERRPVDACNSELVLLREDNELSPGGYEIARGDELTCWSEFELACERADPEVTLDEHAWRAAGGRYVWQLATLRPTEYIPGLHMYELGVDASSKLLHRYRLAKRIFRSRLLHRQAKPLDYLGRPEEHCRVDLHRVLRELKTAGHTWESYCAEVGDEQPMQPKLPLGFVLALMERLNLPDPNVLTARPNRSEMSPVVNDSLLHMLVPRVDFVRYRVAPGVSEEVKATLRKAVDDFSASMQAWKMTTAGAIRMEGEPLPYLCYASDAEELRQHVADLGLRMYAGVMLWLVRTDKLPKELNIAGGWPFAIGHALYLEMEVAGDAA
jgi:hypothetical protein